VSTRSTTAASWLLGHLHELRRAVEALERDLRAAERELASDRRRS
jgi:hypothetical protein